MAVHLINVDLSETDLCCVMYVVNKDRKRFQQYTHADIIILNVTPIAYE